MDPPFRPTSAAAGALRRAPRRVRTHRDDTATRYRPGSFRRPALAGQAAGSSPLDGGRPALLRLEVTENAVTSDAARCMDVLKRLHELDVRLSIDDFGTGYSSMLHQRRLPVDELKIDRSFVLGMTTMTQDAVLVRTALDLGDNLGLTVVAEGVAGREHATALRDLGCDIARGCHFTRPLSVADVTRVLERAALAAGSAMRTP